MTRVEREGEKITITNWRFINVPLVLLVAALLTFGALDLFRGEFGFSSAIGVAGCVAIFFGFFTRTVTVIDSASRTFAVKEISFLGTRLEVYDFADLHQPFYAKDGRLLASIRLGPNLELAKYFDHTRSPELAREINRLAFGNELGPGEEDPKP